MRKLNIGKIKGFFFLAVLLLCSFTLRAEDNNATKEKIMEIKLNEDFIFGEGVSDDKEIAYGVAMDDLLSFANELKDRNSQEKLSMSDLLTKVQTLVYENGPRYEVIVYIPFKIVIETNKKESSAKSGIMITKPGFVTMEEEPESEEEVLMVADNQTVQAVIPHKEEVVETVPVQKEETVKPESPQQVEAIQPESPKQVEPVQTESTKVEETIQPVPVEPLIAQETPKVETPQSNISTDYKGEVEDFILTQDNFTEIKSFLSDMKRSGKIVETGATDSSVNLPQDSSLILIDELGGILAVLSPVNSQGRINYRTQKSDSENNYNSKFIVWYRK